MPDYAPEAADYGNVPEIYVSGLKSIRQIGAGTVRITYYTEFERTDGTMDRRVVLHVVRDIVEWLGCTKRYREAKAQLGARSAGVEPPVELMRTH